MRYVEYCAKPEARSGLMVPVSSLNDIFNRPDSGYTTVYQFSEAAAYAIRQQGDAKGFSRFPVYSDRLWIDIDASDSTPQEVERVKSYTRELTRQFQALDYNFTVWDSGSKGFHIAIKIEPMFGKDVPWSQLTYVQQTLRLLCDYSLYQHGRLLSNPGRLHPKTGRKKTKVFSHQGTTILSIPMIQAPAKLDVDPDSLTNQDLARIGYSRLIGLILDAPIAGNRHTKLWSTASQLLESGMDLKTVCGNLLFCNKFLPQPKDEEEVIRACQQAAHQLGL